MIPSANITKTDGNLGVATETDRILAIIATASAGDFDSPQAFTDKNDIIDTYESGPLVHAAVYNIEQGVPVVCIRADPATPGDYGTIDDSGVTGTATVAEGATVPDDDYRVIVEILVGGELGTAGITFRYSMDDGTSWSDEQALGTSLTLTCDGGVSFTLSASTDTLIAGDTWNVTTTAPVILTTDLADSFTALAAYEGEWLRVLVLTDADATILAQGDTFAKSFHPDGKCPEVIMNTRARGSAESRAAYQTAMTTLKNAVQSLEVSPCVDRCEIVSPVDGRRLVRQPAIAYAARVTLIDDSVDAAAKALGALSGVFVRTASGDDKYHDERRFQGLDALGFTTLRTFGGRPRTPGVYINNARLLSGPGSDFRYFQHTATLNRMIEAAQQLVEQKLSVDVLADPDTGRIREDVAKSIDDAMTATLRTQFVDSTPPKVSAVQFRLSRTDDIISTDTVHFDVRAVPKLYLKKWIGKAGLVRRLPST